MSAWQTVDPVVGQYLDGERSGGVYIPTNFATYSYGRHNPLKYVDPTGEAAICVQNGEQNSCVYVDANFDGNSKDQDLSQTQIDQFAKAYRPYILKNNNMDIGKKGISDIWGGTADDKKMARVASQFVGANLDGGWGNTRMEIGSKYRVGDYYIPVDLGKMDMSKRGDKVEYMIFPANFGQRVKPH